MNLFIEDKFISPQNQPYGLKVIKRSGQAVDFEGSKIANAVKQACMASGEGSKASRIAGKVLDGLSYQTDSVDVEMIQDKVETMLSKLGYPNIAKRYILYREERTKIREEKKKLLNVDALDFVSEKYSLNQLRVLASRYLLRDDSGKITETPTELFSRVALHAYIPELIWDTGKRSSRPKHAKCENDADIRIGRYRFNKYHKKALQNLWMFKKTHRQEVQSYESLVADINEGKVGSEKGVDEFFDMMATGKFLPNSPTLMNAGARLGQLSACFVLPMHDDLHSIMKTVSDAAIIFQSGGGVGINYSDLRPEGSVVASTSGVASGPISFMEIVNKVTDVVKQGGKRRGANMGILNIDHPDIEKFITMKSTPGVMENFNVSVGIWEDFWTALENDGNVTFGHPKLQGKREIKARQLFNLIAMSAWRSAEPGIIFLDNIEKTTPKPYQTIRGGSIISTNPCITGDSLVYTKNGLQRIGELAEQGDLAKVAIDGRMGENTFNKISDIFPSGIKKVYRLVTKEGYGLRLTADHKVMTERGWVPASELKENDKIHILNRKGGFGTKGMGNLGRVLGWLVAEGSLTAGKAVLPFFEKKRALATYFAEMVQSIVPAPTGKRKSYNINVVKIDKRNESRVTSTRLFKVAGSHGLYPQDKLKVPETVFQGTEEMQRGFLSALFTGDGTVCGDIRKGIGVRLSSISITLLKDVQRLLLNFGIASTIYLNRKKAGMKNMPDGKGGHKEYWCKANHELMISKSNMIQFAEEIGFILDYKQKLLTTKIQSYNKGPQQEKFIARFKELIPEGDECVFDLTEPNTHSFVANGIIVSNCGEQALYPYESCNLGSINVAAFIEDGKLNTIRFMRTVHLAARFLDNIIDVNAYPIPEISGASRETRRIGLGIMGVADALFKIGFRYETTNGLEFHDKVAYILNNESFEASKNLGKEKGGFPLFKEDSNHFSWLPSYPYMEEGDVAPFVLRNVVATTVAPTGSIAMIAGCSNGIEPAYSLVYEKRVAIGTFFYVNEILERILKERNIYSEGLIQNIAKNGGSIQNMDEIPQDIKDVFVTAMDIHWKNHINVQALWQRYVGNSISKTINMPSDSSVEDIQEAYIMAHSNGLKGITVYRDKSREQQVLHAGNTEIRCSECGGRMQISSGCSTCTECGNSQCTI